MERAGGQRAVAEEGDGHGVVTALAGCRGCADGDRQSGPDDPVGAEDAEVGIGDVHRAASATTRPAFAAHQLGEHRRHVGALGQAVAVAAMGRGDEVRRPQSRAHTDGDRLLSDRQVHEARNLTVSVEHRHPLLETADAEHLAIRARQLLHVGGRLGPQPSHD